MAAWDSGGGAKNNDIISESSPSGEVGSMFGRAVSQLVGC